MQETTENVPRCWRFVGNLRGAVLKQLKRDLGYAAVSLFTQSRALVHRGDCLADVQASWHLRICCYCDDGILQLLIYRVHSLSISNFDFWNNSRTRWMQGMRRAAARSKMRAGPAAPVGAMLCAKLEQPISHGWKLSSLTQADSPIIPLVSKSP